MLPLMNISEMGMVDNCDLQCKKYSSKQVFTFQFLRGSSFCGGKIGLE